MAEGWSRFALRFSEYYDSLNTDSLWVPPRLRNREWMFIPWGGALPHRHKSFSDKGQLHNYLRTRGPHSCFHSTAYYDFPNVLKMSEKGWKGADLIFDLDGDHLPGVEDNDFPRMIETIQEQAWKLWSEFLEPEFGFKEEYVQTSFSGHRGFHIHVRDPRYFHLDSNARREIVNYIRGEGIDIQSTLAGGQNGWGKRVHSGIEKVLEKLEIIREKGSKSKMMIDEMHELLNNRARSKTVQLKSKSKYRIMELSELAESNDRVDRLRKDHTLSVFGDVCTPIFWELVRGDSSVVLSGAGETDEAVTVDTKRVIRWVGSLHGKSGLRVTEFPLERLDPDSQHPFDPLNETVVFGNKKFDIEITQDDISAKLCDQKIEASSGEKFSVNENMAIFLCLKGWAKLSK